MAVTLQRLGSYALAAVLGTLFAALLLAIGAIGLVLTVLLMLAVVP